MKRIKRLLLSIMLLLTLVIISTKDTMIVKAGKVAPGVEYPLGDYVETQPVNGSTIVYVSEDIVPYLREAGITVRVEEHKEGWWIFSTNTYLYSYMATQFIDKVIQVRSLDTSMDTLVYMLQQLQTYTYGYMNENTYYGDANNLILGYIRNIHTGYADGRKLNGIKGVMFSTICGEAETKFINYVNESESRKFSSTNENTIDIKTYFYTFLEDKKTYNSIYGEIKEEFINMERELIDPATKKTIDMIHMFCSLDGLETLPKTSIDAQLQDLISWTGDLHQATAELKIVDLNTFNFENHILDISDSGFHYSDFYADIDAYNIGRSYLTANNANGGRISLWSSISAYYTTIKKDSKFRYKAFIKNVSYYADNLLESPLNIALNATAYTETRGFNSLVGMYMNINTFNYYLNDMKFFETVDPRFYFLTHAYNLDSPASMPTYEVRKVMVKGFINYVCVNAGYGELY